MKRTSVYFVFFLLISAFNVNSQSQDGWIELFSGKDLKGWKQLNGKAEYKIEDGMIVGISVPKESNSFLATEKMYDDFILELEINVEAPLNSGIQFRSNSLPDFKKGRVHGYQCEIDPSGRAWSGGIYDEARRGWLYNLASNKAGQNAFNVGDWNTYRIEAIGNTIRTWINGVMCSNLVDNETSSGFIALQVHEVGNDPNKIGKTIKWKNIRIKIRDLETSRMKADPGVPEINLIPNTLSQSEIRKGWRLLWDGKTSNGWRGAKLDHFPKEGWEMEDGILEVLESGGGESEHGGDIVTMERFSNFELELDFMITKGANSGIKYLVQTELNLGVGSAIGLEYQLLDDNLNPDAKNGVEGNRTLASLYDLIPRENLSEGGQDIRFTGIEQWNRARIVVNGDHVEHWINNIKVVDYDRGSQLFRALVQKSKYKNWPMFGEWQDGHILLQDHGNAVRFRSIKIREF
ncbi:DUF1080 domain-containing protein [Bacteroidota bacterium]